jgi:hypothetical protein
MNKVAILPAKISKRLRYWNGVVSCYGKTKYFGIGLNKTGTTSLAAAMRQLGFRIGNQRDAELLLHDWAIRDFRRLIHYCRSAQFFQDFPFSYPFTFIAMDQAFPGSKFILTIRDSPEQWVDSRIRFHSKIFGKNGQIPTREDLKEAVYIYKGRPLEIQELNGLAPGEDPYDKELMKERYINHNQCVRNYFRNRHDDLLELNVSEEDAFQKLCKFTGKISSDTRFPWKNKTLDIRVRCK